jgi:ribosomal protein RSM22 (predicted rRNA methylase)
MKHTFANFPEQIALAIDAILLRQETDEWVSHAVALHHRYTERVKPKDTAYITGAIDAIAYLALRAPATYAQFAGVFAATQEVLPSWQPKTLLDIGGGPGTAIWAAQNIWPSLEQATSIDRDANLTTAGKQIAEVAKIPVVMDWQLEDLRRGVPADKTYDIVVIGNVLNELHPSEGEKLLGQAFNVCSGVLLIVEPGTPFGSGIVVSTAKKLQKVSHVIAPYIDNSLVVSEDFWLHFSQRFIRPEFSRRIRQRMRDTLLMASDWEDAKYSYAAISKIPQEFSGWGRVIGPIKSQKGFIEVPVMTKQAFETIKVMKRDKNRYVIAKNLRWGDLIRKEL